MGFETLLKRRFVLLIVLVVLALGAFWVGRMGGYQSGYAQAQSDIQNLQKETARKAGEEAAKSANPFQAVNPLEGVQANPFQKVKKILNPFEN